MGNMITKSLAFFGENLRQSAWQTLTFLLLWGVVGGFVVCFSPAALSRVIRKVNR